MLQEGEIIIQITITPDTETTMCCLFCLTNKGNIYYKPLTAKDYNKWFKIELPNE